MEHAFQTPSFTKVHVPIPGADINHNVHKGAHCRTTVPLREAPWRFSLLSSSSHLPHRCKNLLLADFSRPANSVIGNRMQGAGRGLAVRPQRAGLALWGCGAA